MVCTEVPLAAFTMAFALPGPFGSALFTVNGNVNQPGKSMPSAAETCNCICAAVFTGIQVPCHTLPAYTRLTALSPFVNVAWALVFAAVAVLPQSSMMV